MKNMRLNRIARQIADLQQAGISPPIEVMESYEKAKRDAYIGTEIDRARIVAITIAEGVCLSMEMHRDDLPSVLHKWQVEEIAELREALRKLNALSAEQTALLDGYKRELEGLI